MTRLLFVLAVFAFAAGLAATTAFGQAVPPITFDENGNGNVGGALLPTGIAVDPISGIPTLFYTLPFPTIGGDLLLFEANQQQPSDIVRFIQGTPQVFFFSEREQTDVPPFDLADVGVLPPAQPLSVPLVEVGPEGANGVVWVPGPGAPGFPTTGVAATYNIISDVPEPGSWLLASVGCGLLLALRRRR